MCVRYPDLIKKAQINSLAIYDATDPVVKIVVTLREIILEVMCKILEKTKFIAVRDLKTFDDNIIKKIKKRIEIKILSVSSYFKRNAYEKQVFDITKDLFISIRLLWKPEEGSVLYIPTEVRYYYGEI